MKDSDDSGTLRSRALVTGGSGVLGRQIAGALLERGTAVRILDRASPPPGLEKAEFIMGDITDADRVDEACRGCSVVFHLAARMPQAFLSDEAFYEVNVSGTRHIIDGCTRHGVPVLVFASTIEIYGPRTDFPVREDAPKLFTGVYSRNKWECEQMLHKARERHGLHVSMLRMPMIVGPGFYHEKSVLEMMRRVRRGKPLPLPGGPDIPLTIVAASDAANAFLAAAERKEADGKAFNIASGRGEPTRAFFSRFINAVGSRSRIVPIPRWIMSPVVSLSVRLGKPFPLVGTPAELLPFSLTGGDYDISCAREHLGYAPKKDCLTAMVEVYNWLQERSLI